MSTIHLFWKEKHWVSAASGVCGDATSFAKQAIFPARADRYTVTFHPSEQAARAALAKDQQQA